MYFFENEKKKKIPKDKNRKKKTPAFSLCCTASRVLAYESQTSRHLQHLLNQKKNPAHIGRGNPPCSRKGEVLSQRRRFSIYHAPETHHS